MISIRRCSECVCVANAHAGQSDIGGFRLCVWQMCMLGDQTLVDLDWRLPTPPHNS